MSAKEHKDTCDICGNKGGSTFARVFYSMIGGKWKWLCSVCWDKRLDMIAKQEMARELK